jgi:hypothetical protein
MDSQKLFETVFYASLSANGFLASYLLSGIKSQIRSLRREMTDLKEEQARQSEKNNLMEYRMSLCESSMNLLPCRKENICQADEL